MADTEINAAKAAFNERTGSGSTRRSMSDKDYREFRTSPLLMLHVLKLRYQRQGDSTEHELQDVVAWGMSFPATTVEDTEVEYVVNTRWWNENFGEDLEEYVEESAGAA
jgi:hypothetical protein